MKFKILQHFTSVEVYLSQFLKVSKKNIHTIRMNSHHNKETIKINTKEAGLNSPLTPTDVLEVNIDLGTSNYKENLEISITKEFEDDYLLIVSKPFGIKTHPNDIELETDTLINYLISEYNYLEPIHRLDIDTCGLVILAKTPLIKAKLDQMLEKREIKRYYSALIKNNKIKQMCKKCTSVFLVIYSRNSFSKEDLTSIVLSVIGCGNTTFNAPRYILSYL